MISVIRVSNRRYNVAEISTDGMANLQIYTNNKFGEHNEMFSPNEGKLLLEKSVDYRQAMYVAALLSKGVPLHEITDNVKGD